MFVLKSFFLLSLICGVTGFCIQDGQKLTCFNEMTFEDYVVTAKSLYLYNSFINRNTLREKLPNVDVVYVYGHYVSETCAEIQYIVEIYGCHGKRIDRKRIATFTSQILALTAIYDSDFKDTVTTSTTLLAVFTTTTTYVVHDDDDDNLEDDAPNYDAAIVAGTVPVLTIVFVLVFVWLYRKARGLPTPSTSATGVFGFSFRRQASPQPPPPSPGPPRFQSTPLSTIVNPSYLGYFRTIFLSNQYML